VSELEALSMPATDSLEVEWQFEVGDLDDAERVLRARASALGLELTPSGDRRLLDQYLETPDWAFHRAGFALRVRGRDGIAEATLKAFDDQTEGPRRRREISEPLVGADRLALLTTEGPVTERVRAVVGARELRRLFTLRTRRRTFDLAAAGSGVVAEIALDRTEVEPNRGDAAASLLRIELELADPEALAAVEPLAGALGEADGFARASTSKFGAGLAAAALAPAPAPDLGPSAIDRGSSIGEVAYAALRRQFAAYLANEPGTRLGEDIEALHDMRVATRRMRTAMAIFAGVLPAEVLALRDGMGWLADVLGEVRDLDVQLEWLRAEAAAHPAPGTPQGSPLLPVVACLERHRAEARVRMLAALNSARHAGLVEAATSRLRAGATTPEGATPALRAAPVLLRKPWKRLDRRARRLLPASPAADYHAARIRAKRLRYAAEFVTGLYGKPAARLVAALKRTQDELGRRQDAAINIERLERLAAEESLPPAAVFAMGELAERERADMRSIGSAFPVTYRRLRRRWRTLDAALERGLADG
jgi:CHAD domain-containing protein